MLLLGLTACEDFIESNKDNERTDRDYLFVSILVTDVNGRPMPNVAVDMYEDDFPVTYTNILFGKNENDYMKTIANKQAVESVVTDEEGVANFIFVYGHYDHLASIAYFASSSSNTQVVQSSTIYRYFFAVDDGYYKSDEVVAIPIKIGNESVKENLTVHLKTDYQSGDFIYGVAPEFNDVLLNANADGTFSVSFKVNNTRLKSLLILDKNSDVVADLLTDEVRDGFVNEVVSQNLPVDEYYIVAKTIDDYSADLPLGENIDYVIGALMSETGSYLSIVDNESLTMYMAKTKAAEVIAISSDDGYSVMGLKKATDARSLQVVAIAGKVAFFQDGLAESEVGVNGVIFTESGCICKINSIVNDYNGNAIINMYTIKRNDKIKIIYSDSFSK